MNVAVNPQLTGNFSVDPQIFLSPNVGILRVGCPIDVEMSLILEVLLLFPIPLEQESLHQVRLTIPRNSLTHQALFFIQLSQGNAPAVQKMSRRSKERAGTGKERLYPFLEVKPFIRGVDQDSALHSDKVFL
ncbi:hypothetical protein TNCV_2821831 [Trichonephila clavipes]|uniref:Uncharacterized protein n=1 Tax=Trichonephila clavipes TaxID=2585209 RepID=A0A8X6WGI7_TRICX|nr:hypothetical protein TNCV_2821801 [Trichonephila clavipes]GFY34497.1 hypothetical protein TNCV_2821831 [Trichonephila clavipes]